MTFAGARPAPALLERMGDALRHRGPDAVGFEVDATAAPAVGLVHRRLAVLDLSPAANQPLRNEDGSVVAMLNGEIYNFRELRRELEGRHVFRSHGDTEVIVHGYEDRGDAIVGALDGMFALALWDRARRRLLLARDAFGKKPLYYWHDARRFVFGSEIKALLAAGVPAELADENLAESLALGYVPTPRTLFRGIAKLPPASMIAVDAGGVAEPRQYWDLAFARPGGEARLSFDDAAVRVSELLVDAVRKRLVADVPVGVLLSGGLDSSAVAAIAARLGSGKVKTFTVGFEGDAFYDERAHAGRVAAHLGTDHHADVVKPEAAALIETLLHHHDEPFGDSSALPTYLVAREARRHVTVALNGDGADETFAGYDRFHAALLAERVPSAVLRGLSASARALPARGGQHTVLARLRRFATKAALPLDQRLSSWAGVFDLPGLAALGADGVADADRVFASYRQALDRCGETSVLSRLLYVNARTYLLDDLLPKMDRMTMAHGLEARSPFLDRALVEFVATLPDVMKRKRVRGKLVLRRAVEDLLPRETLERRKQGFGVPLGAWFRSELKPLAEDLLLSSPRLGRRLRMSAVRAIFAEHLSGRADRGHQLWSLLTLELWLRKHRFE
ncbi:MAG: asparagine synthase (glutamine-hydrolyzing) [Candidatus Rokubacteria bacterium]|nr:asparagine synthase (glutamine-hydrolyzing) [Candidatus Rokubacteria bacterium]